jgi:hypothetical protein
MLALAQIYTSGGGMMKVLLLVFAVTLSQTQSKPQTLPEWYRVYTFEDSIIVLNTDYVMFSSRKTGRVRFRWSFSNLEPLSGEPQVKYKYRLEEIECDCRDKRFRLHDVRSYDADGRLVRVETADPPDKWQEVRFGSMMEKLFRPACQLIELRKRVPALER